ncbi:MULTISPECIES: type II toxin-antitoxin system RelE/ParE family toxin [unclassified Corynebacterium]|uniref:type II toxin-antitoxin system RelE family toxin n=1 Tax=Corynebacterium TaxID=1716 RepID=UPI00254FAF1D|nr:MULTISPECIES: type II toxin-antitoxin system RelE/ParE family toxin [unclassified Corynebacterium]MDK8476683.1 type II toxin-antitoxin system RelE/ParE family toxin [Corynebacterium sp. MSK310]MDK8491838.1 type II toxin-antitoxin system RelE/ParE family toxin [Corynebacterium sp. MSK175]MDK8672839.1 type II toxin-antitoxin system RelE/ParE family toxin [Corynebacterium sp. MSK189]MDK8736258.1 type II toxin-antitoxin system RelE/ParE family toxin [Corynebacterium sp. MSK306]MDK8787262.1 type
MVWSIEFTPRAAKAFRKLDKLVQKQISKFLREVAELDDPRVRGKGLVADKSGLWRWRVEDYRVIVSILDETVVVNVIDVGHRRNIYL